MSRHDRLKKLEANRPAPRPTEAAAPAHEDDLYFYFEQHRRALEGVHFWTRSPTASRTSGVRRRIC